MTLREHLDDCARASFKIADHPCWGDGSHYSYGDGYFSQLKRDEDNFIDLYFRYLAACRDYPYAQHDPPRLEFSEQLVRQIEQEFRRSNPGFVIP